MRRMAIVTVILSLLLTTPVCAGAKKDGDGAGSGGNYEPFRQLIHNYHHSPSK